jgi:hypothetical protein
LGTPTISLVTEPFRGLANATARGRKIPDLPTIVLPRGYDRLPEEDIRADIRRHLSEMLGAVTHPKPAPVEASPLETATD